MELGLFLRAFQDLCLEEALSRTRTLEITNIEIAVHRGNGHVDLDDLTNKGSQKRLLELLARYGLNLVALDVHRESQLVLGPLGKPTQRFCEGTPEEQVKYGVQRTKLAAQVAAELGVPVVVGYTGCPEFSSWYPWPHDSWDEMERLFTERWEPILRVYDALGVRYAHEINLQQMVYNIETAEKALDLFATHRSWGYTLDPANLLLAGIEPSAAAAVLGPKIYHVHAKDGEFVRHAVVRSGWMAHGAFARPKRGFRYRIPGWGQVKWRELISELRSGGYNGVVSIEHEDAVVPLLEDGLGKSIDFLRPLMLK